VSDLPPDKVTPYIGLIPYAEQDAPFFFGRERERAMITANLMASRLTVLYGPSGAGKSSVLRAGVQHTLREQAQRNFEEHGEPELGVVVFNNWRDDPLVGLSLAVHEVVKQALATMSQVDDSAPVPQELVENLEAWTKRLDGELLIILDQFEEYFMYHAQEDGEHTFAVEFPRAVNSVGLRVNFLLSLREDALSKLDRFKGRIPNLFDNYLRIGHLTQEAARDAIEKPLEEYNRRQASEADQVTIEPALVEAVLSQVQTGRVTLAREGSGGVAESSPQAEATIETSYLQLVMTRLWHEEMQAGSRTLRLSTLEQLQGAEHIVRTHLDSVMDHLSAEESAIAADVFRYLVTPSGTKIAYTKTDLVAYTNTPGAQLAPVLEKLSGSGLRILRTVDPPPDQPRETRYEIFHDVLAAAILDWRGRYMQEKEKRELEQRLAEEVRAEQQRAEEERRQKELEDARKLAELESRRAEAEAKASSRLRRLATALVVVSLIAFVAAVLAVIGWNQTESARAQLNGIVEGLRQAAKTSGEQEVAARATAQVASTQAAGLQATSEAGARLPAATATAQAAAARAAATQAVAAQATASAASAQATAQAAVAGLVPWGKSLSGVGMGNPQPFTQEQLKAIADSKVEAVKILTLPDPDQNKQLVTDLRKIQPDMFIVARLFFSVDASSKQHFSPQDFVNFVDGGMKALYDSGVRYFEIHNEPNLETEGMNWNWTSGAEFGSWFIQVYNILKQRYPEAKLGYPGLSPQPNVDAFLDDSAAAANSADWIGVHAYWQQPSNQPPYPINGDNAGMYWRAKFKPRFPNKMLMITEFSNNSSNTSYVDKGQQYAQYYQMLRNEPNIGGAFSAYLSWPGQDINREGWVVKDAETEIPTTVGGLIGKPGFLDGSSTP
jgi:hypothetical protein